MTETDLQLGGGYTYQWECAILLALNYFFEPLRYNRPSTTWSATSWARSRDSCWRARIGRGVELEDIPSPAASGGILVQVKTKQAEGERLEPDRPPLLKALQRFYDSRSLATSRRRLPATSAQTTCALCFLTNRPLTRPGPVRTPSAPAGLMLSRGGQGCTWYLDHTPEEKGTALEWTAPRMLARTALVDTCRGHGQAKRPGQAQAYAGPTGGKPTPSCSSAFARQRHTAAGGPVTREIAGGGPGAACADRREAEPLPLPSLSPRTPTLWDARRTWHELQPALTGERPSHPARRPDGDGAASARPNWPSSMPIVTG